MYYRHLKTHVNPYGIVVAMWKITFITCFWPSYLQSVDWSIFIQTNDNNPGPQATASNRHLLKCFLPTLPQLWNSGFPEFPPTLNRRWQVDIIKSYHILLLCYLLRARNKSFNTGKGMSGDCQCDTQHLPQALQSPKTTNLQTVMLPGIKKLF